jgi:hypothetical protein
MPDAARLHFDADGMPRLDHLNRPDFSQSHMSDAIAAAGFRQGNGRNPVAGAPQQAKPIADFPDIPHPFR